MGGSVAKGERDKLQSPQKLRNIYATLENVVHYLGGRDYIGSV
jgi:hypothetical protein